MFSINIYSMRLRYFDVIIFNFITAVRDGSKVMLCYGAVNGTVADPRIEK